MFPNSIIKIAPIRFEEMPEPYDISLLRKPQSVVELGSDFASLKDVIGFDVYKRENLHLIENDMLVYVTGCAVVFHTISTGTKEYLMGLDDAGVSCVTIHPSK